MIHAEVKFSEWLEQGFAFFKENINALILPSLLAVVVSMVSLGILAGPMMIGLILITLRLLDKSEPAPQAGDVFQGFAYFLNAFLLVLVSGAISIAGSLVLNLVPCIGQIASIFFSFGLGTALMFAPFLIAEKKMDFWPAAMESIEKVKTNFWPFFGFYVVASILGSLGAIACGIGIIVTLPLYIGCIAIAYRSVYAEVVPVADAPVVPPELPSDPPTAL